MPPGIPHVHGRRSQVLGVMGGRGQDQFPVVSFPFASEREIWLFCLASRHICRNIMAVILIVRMGDLVTEMKPIINRLIMVMVAKESQDFVSVWPSRWNIV